MTETGKKLEPRRYNIHNLSGQPGSQLKDGEVTRTHRIRAAPEVQAWFASLTSEQRGKYLAKLMHAQNTY